ncbi:hypothetical protein Noda2021_11840 [Candidatus Dependentiae bacterium Noda2021]|nr:hypothetical protein Noda2021_11840 [Candidatus Dependentiae bacterium Noda2021]
MAAIALHSYSINASYLTIACALSLLGLIYAPTQALQKLFMFGLVFTLGSYHTHSFIAHHTTFLTNVQNIRLSALGVIDDIQPTTNATFKYKVIIEIKKLTFNDKTSSDANHKLQIYTNSVGSLLVSDEVIIYNICIPRAKSSFLYYLYKEGISASAFTNTLDYKLINRPTYSLKRAIHALREKIFARIGNSSNAFSTISTLFWGNRIGEEKEIKERFKQWGVSHYLARSGLHLIIVIMILQMLLSVTPLSYNTKQIMLIACVISYSFLTWSSVSFVRALGMFLVYKIATLCNKPIHYLHLVTLVSLAVLLANPFYLFFLDFQLSFGLTFSLAWFNQVAYSKTISSKNYC